MSVAAVFFVNGAVYGSWAPRLPEVRERVDVTLAQLGLVLSGAALVALGGTIGAGWFVDRIGSRRAVAVAGLVAVAALAGIGIARSPLVLVAALALVSAGDVVQDVAMNVQAVEVSRRRATPVMSRLHGLWSLGTVVGALAAARLAAIDVSLTAHLLIAAVLLGATTIAAVTGLLAEDPPVPDRAPVATRWRGSRMAVALALLGFLAIALELVPADWSALRLVDDLDTSAATAGLAFVAFSAGMLLGRLAGDAMVVRLGGQRTLTAGSVFGAFGIALGMLAPSVSISIAGFAIAGLGMGPIFPEIYAQAARTPGIRAGVGIAFMTTGQRIGALLLPIAVGFLADIDRLAVGQAAVLATLPCAAGLVVLVRRMRFDPGD